jgi:hypothetical protein
VHFTNLRIRKDIWHSACIYLYMKLIKLLIGLALGIGVLSCEPDLCEDCYTVTNAEGSYWECVEYDCSNEYVPGP